ncbi:MAG: DUF58 domain-containing protein [Elusimicrobiota bacterium]|nr:DUF58 domain-containing protein [Elusimicrobiota bacterium]
MPKTSSPKLKSKFLRPEIIAKISRMNFAGRKISEGTVAGSHSSPFRGCSSEFSSFRPYAQGDDTRHLDWKVYARCERFYVRQFEQETNMRSCLILDRSESMNFASGAMSKYDYARIIASTLAYLITKRGDSMAFSAVSTGVDEYFPPSRSAGNLVSVLNAIASIEPSGGTAVASAMDLLGAKIKRKTLIILISDMLTDSDGIIKSIRTFIKQKHNFMVLHVTDPAERELPSGGKFTFVDSETRERVTINSLRSAASYRRQFSDFVSGIENSLKNCGCGYFRFTVSSRPEDEIPEGLFKAGFSFI